MLHLQKLGYSAVSYNYFALPHSFNRLSAASFDEASFSYLTKLQVLDVGQGNPDLFAQRKETEGGALTKEDEET